MTPAARGGGGGGEAGEVAAPLLAYKKSPGWVPARCAALPGDFLYARALRYAQLEQKRLRERTSPASPPPPPTLPVVAWEGGAGGCGQLARSIAVLASRGE